MAGCPATAWGLVAALALAASRAGGAAGGGGGEAAGSGGAPGSSQQEAGSRAAFQPWVALAPPLLASRVRLVRAADQKAPASGDDGEDAGFAYESCAVVGSSRRMLRRRDGPLIDAHATVIRFNEAPTEGVEEHVGSNTTLRVQNALKCGFAERDGEACMGLDTIAMWNCKRRRKKSVAKCAAVQPAGGDAMYRFLDRFWLNLPGGVPPGLAKRDVACSLFKPPQCKKRLSGGLSGLLIAMSLCERVGVFGFTHNGGDDHYFEKRDWMKQNGTKVARTRKDWTLKHHWRLERHALDLLRNGLDPRVTVH